MTRRPSKNWPGGSTRRYREVRVFVLQRDGHRCRLLYPGCLGVATQAHHLDDRAEHGDDPARMVAACPPCNIKAGTPSASRQPAPTPITRW